MRFKTVLLVGRAITYMGPRQNEGWTLRLRASRSQSADLLGVETIHRDIIVGDRPDVTLVYLKGSYDLIRRRMATRHEHFMPVALLDSQFAMLQEPTPDEHPIIVDVGSRPAEIAVELVRQLEERHGTDSGIEFIATGGGRGNLHRRVTMTPRVKEF